MANVKITDLTALSGALADADLFGQMGHRDPRY